MKEKSKKKKRTCQYTVGQIIVFSILTIFYLILVAVWIYNCDKIHGQLKAVESGVIVEAEYTSIGAHTRSDSDYGHSIESYYLIYEYSDGNVNYRGIGKSGIQYKEDAEKHIGEKINIYIDGKGHSISVGEKPSVVGVIVETIITVALFYPMVCLPLLMKNIEKWKEKRKDRKEKREALIAYLEEERKKEEEDNIFKNS